MACRTAEGLPRAAGRLDRDPLRRQVAPRGSPSLLSPISAPRMNADSRTRRKLRVLVRRHGPSSPVWRRRAAMGTGAILVGLVALLFADMANEAIAIFRAHIAAIWW